MRVIYLYDTLCSWCMVASPQIRQFRLNIAAPHSFDAIHIRLFTDGFQPTMDQAFFDRARHVGTVLGPSKTGIEFSESYLSMIQKKGFMHDSHETSLAVSAANHQDRNLGFIFEENLQNSIFLEGKNPHCTDTFIEVAKGCGLDIELFKQHLQSQQNQEMAKTASESARIVLEHSGKKGVPQLIAFDDTQIIGLNPFDAEESLGFLQSL